MASFAQAQSKIGVWSMVEWLQWVRPGILSYILFVALAHPALADDLDAYFARNNEASDMIVDHQAWADILTAYVRPSPGSVNLFAYGKVTSNDRAKLKSYLKSLQAKKITAANRNEQRAFWINLYNALTIDVVLDHYPVKSIREITFGLFSFGPWGKKFVTVEGNELSLDDIEHKILRKLWPDPRIHYAVNCASMGCPNLQAVPFMGKNLEAMLDKGAREYINHKRGVAVSADGKVTASSIFDWYRADFGKNDAEILAHMRLFAEPTLKAKLQKAARIGAYEYDWSLNEGK
jgi:hypothetical protein